MLVIVYHGQQTTWIATLVYASLQLVRKDGQNRNAFTVRKDVRVFLHFLSDSVAIHFAQNKKSRKGFFV